jgi:enolase
LNNNGLGRLTAVNNVNKYIEPVILGLDASPNKSNLGAKYWRFLTMAMVSMLSQCVLLHGYLGGVGTCILPILMMNILNGGKHVSNSNLLNSTRSASVAICVCLLN